jgi:hypothetical protein
MHLLHHATLQSVHCVNKHLDQCSAPAWGVALVAAGVAGQPWGWLLLLGQLALMWPLALALLVQGWQLASQPAWAQVLLHLLLQAQLA